MRIKRKSLLLISFKPFHRYRPTHIHSNKSALVMSKIVRTNILPVLPNTLANLANTAFITEKNSYNNINPHVIRYISHLMESFLSVSDNFATCCIVYFTAFSLLKCQKPLYLGKERFFIISPLIQHVKSQKPSTCLYTYIHRTIRTLLNHFTFRR